MCFRCFLFLRVMSGLFILFLPSHIPPSPSFYTPTPLPFFYLPSGCASASRSSKSTGVWVSAVWQRPQSTRPPSVRRRRRQQAPVVGAGVPPPPLPLGSTWMAALPAQQPGVMLVWHLPPTSPPPPPLAPLQPPQQQLQQVVVVVVEVGQLPHLGVVVMQERGGQGG